MQRRGNRLVTGFQVKKRAARAALLPQKLGRRFKRRPPDPQASSPRILDRSDRREFAGQRSSAAWYIWRSEYDCSDWLGGCRSRTTSAIDTGSPLDLTPSARRDQFLRTRAFPVYGHSICFFELASAGQRTGLVHRNPRVIRSCSKRTTSISISVSPICRLSVPRMRPRHALDKLRNHPAGMHLRSFCHQSLPFILDPATPTRTDRFRACRAKCPCPVSVIREAVGRHH